MNPGRRPGPAPKPAAEKVASLIRVYFTPGDRDRVLAAADAAGVSRSEYCRDAVLARLSYLAENARRQELQDEMGRRHAPPAEES